MSYLNDGKYYLIKQNENETNRIPLNEKWFLKDGKDILREGNDIASIDLITMKFKNMDEMKARMIKNGYIKKGDNLFIVSSNKFNNKEYVSEFDFIFKGRFSFLMEKISTDRLTTGRIHKSDSEKIVKELLGKMYKNNLFYEFMTNAFTEIDPSFVEKVMRFKKEAPNYYSTLIYQLGNRERNYSFIRNIVATWHIYDFLIQKHYGEEIKPNDLINDYLEIKGTKNKEKIREKLNKNYVEGQMNMNEWLEKNSNEKENLSIREMFSENITSNDSDDYFKEIHDLEREVKNSPFDSPLLNDLKNEGLNNFDIVEKLSSAEFQKLSMKDRYKLGMVDIITYKNTLHDGKRYH